MTTDATPPRSFAFAGRPGFLDRVEGAPLPLLRAIGWYDGDDLPPIALRLADREIAPLSTARQHRADVLAAGASARLFSGFRVDFLFEAGEEPVTLRIGSEDVAIARGAGYGRIDPHYRHLFTEKRVLGRDAIYGSGPPVDVSDEFKAFVGSAVHGRVLDFGCGNGDLVAWLRGRGVDAEGIELDEPRTRDALRPDAAGHVRYYDGSLPMPFADATFDAIASTEVIEHVAGMHRYVGELARVLKPGGRLVLTTPDITSIPSAFPANCVPWHLLEATHVNFFTPRSVEALFAGAFRMERLFCLGGSHVNGLFVPGSIGAVLAKT